MLSLQEKLQQVSVFSELPLDQIHWLIEQGQETQLNPGDILRREGDLADCVFVMLEGQLRIYQELETHELVLTTYNTLDFFGELPILTGEEKFWASGRAVVPCHIFELPKAAFWQLLSRCPSVTIKVLSTMAQRMQDVQTIYKHNEKLAALGTLAAGLAHEMNNPAAAILRCSQDLGEVLPQLAIHSMRPPPLTEHQQETVEALYQQGTQQMAEATLDPLTRSDREDQLTDWLEEKTIADAEKLVTTLVSAGFDVNHLNHLATNLPQESLSAVLQWLSAALAGEEMLKTIQVGTHRIFELVNAIKDYSFMDQSPIQTLDIHKSLEDTLTILSYRLKQGDITIERNYDANISPIEAYGSELNQAWTYLINNAIDALAHHPAPVITICTCQEKQHLVVEISDNGPGIPVEIQSRIFDKFFTTKAVGQGTGLGLDMTHRIVRKHRGDICFNSSPGNTQFSVRLPIHSRA
ncbi:MAG: ATP-binding protein [Cyanobacteria bacterium P01_F01_bin.3]